MHKNNSSGLSLQLWGQDSPSVDLLSSEPIVTVQITATVTNTKNDLACQLNRGGAAGQAPIVNRPSIVSRSLVRDGLILATNHNQRIREPYEPLRCLKNKKEHRF